MTESQEDAKLKKVTILAILTDSVFLRTPAQAKGLPHFCARIVTFTQFITF